MRPLRLLRSVVAGTAALSVAARVSKRVYRRETGHDEVHYVTTDDGWRIALSRYRARGSRRTHPVLLVPGLSANRAIFDQGEDLSLARDLAHRGHDVFVVELRGHGRSDRPDRSAGRSFGWSFDTHVEQDLRAAVGHALNVTGAGKLHWVGHSMGGLLLYATLATWPDAPIQSGITVGSSLDYAGEPSDFHALKRILPLAHALPSIPVEQVGALLAPFAGRFDSATDRFNFYLPNTDPKVVRSLSATSHHDVSSPVFLQLSTALSPGGLTSVDGSKRYQGLLGHTDVPVFAIAGTHDRQCSPGSVQRTLAALRHPDCRFQLFGKEAGHHDEYGHCDLLVGRRARHEVFPHLFDWLQAHDDVTADSAEAA